MTGRVEVVDESGAPTPAFAMGELAEAVLVEERSAGTLDLVLVGEPSMSDLNRYYRGEQGPTDVLSFPESRAGDWWPETASDPPDGETVTPRPFLGEIVICPAVVRRYAEEEGSNLEYQLGWTVIHGTLHLLGYDHERDGGEMRAREQVLLAGLADMLQRLSVPEES